MKKLLNDAFIYSRDFIYSVYEWATVRLKSKDTILRRLDFLKSVLSEKRKNSVPGKIIISAYQKYVSQ